MRSDIEFFCLCLVENFSRRSAVAGSTLRITSNRHENVAEFVIEELKRDVFCVCGSDEGKARVTRVPEFHDRKWDSDLWTTRNLFCDWLYRSRDSIRYEINVINKSRHLIGDVDVD